MARAVEFKFELECEQTEALVAKVMQVKSPKDDRVLTRTVVNVLKNSFVKRPQMPGQAYAC